MAWFDGPLDLDPAKLVFIDETGLSTKMSLLRGRSQCGEYRPSAVPHCHWKTTTFTGALKLSGMTASMVLDGPMYGVAFLAYIEQVLVPLLRPRQRHYYGQFACSQSRRCSPSHRSCWLLYLPPCSPDFNPIEMAFSKLKALLRAKAERSVDALWDTSVKSFRSSNHRNVQTTSRLQVMTRNKTDAL
ncbi:transposase [Agrobacterium rosae]|uniref:transposase n=1 Tax=Agrobacterium rosae TaxID=1972867 RepID=UPI00142D4BD8|nr:transposase [Agrobacterium rosae]